MFFYYVPWRTLLNLRNRQILLEKQKICQFKNMKLNELSVFELKIWDFSVQNKRFPNISGKIFVFFVNFELFSRTRETMQWYIVQKTSIVQKMNINTLGMSPGPLHEFVHSNISFHSPSKLVTKDMRLVATFRTCAMVFKFPIEIFLNDRREAPVLFFFVRLIFLTF